MKNLTYDIIAELADAPITFQEWNPGYFQLFWKINGVSFNALTHFHHDRLYAIECEDWPKLLGTLAVANLTMPAPDENDDQI